MIEKIKIKKRKNPKKNKVEYENIIKKYIYNNSNIDPIDSYIKLIEQS